MNVAKGPMNLRPVCLEKEGTITNLKQVGFPDVSDETVVVRTDVSSKENVW